MIRFKDFVVLNEASIYDKSKYPEGKEVQISGAKGALKTKLSKELAKLGYKSLTKFKISTRTDVYKNIEIPSPSIEEVTLEDKDGRTVKIFSSGSQMSSTFKNTGGVKGAGGLKYEAALAQDLTTYFEDGMESTDLTHITMINRIVKELKIKKTDEVKIIHAGGANTKRKLIIENGEIYVYDKNPFNHAALLTDITMVVNNVEHYLSVKMSKTFFIGNVGLSSVLPDDKKRIEFLTKLGIDALRFDLGFGVIDKHDYFDDPKDEKYYTKMYEAEKDYPLYDRYQIRLSEAQKNITLFMKTIFGAGYVMVYKNGKKEVVEMLDNDSIYVSKLSEKSYFYPKSGKRNYMKIIFRVIVNRSHIYDIDMQFRDGTSSAKRSKFGIRDLPKNIRVLVKPK